MTSRAFARGAPLVLGPLEQEPGLEGPVRVRDSLLDLPHAVLEEAVELGHLGLDELLALLDGNLALVQLAGQAHVNVEREVAVLVAPSFRKLQVVVDHQGDVLDVGGVVGGVVAVRRAIVGSGSALVACPACPVYRSSECDICLSAILKAMVCLQLRCRQSELVVVG